jgi:hypothetical protein
MAIRVRLVVEELHDVITHQHMLSTSDELAVCPARVIGETLAIGPVRNPNHHPSALFDENRMFDQTRQGADCSCIFAMTSLARSSVAASPIIILVTGIESFLNYMHRPTDQDGARSVKLCDGYLSVTRSRTGKRLENSYGRTRAEVLIPVAFRYCRYAVPGSTWSGSLLPRSVRSKSESKLTI